MSDPRAPDKITYIDRAVVRPPQAQGWATLRDRALCAGLEAHVATLAVDRAVEFKARGSDFCQRHGWLAATDEQHLLILGMSPAAVIAKRAI